MANWPTDPEPSRVILRNHEFNVMSTSVTGRTQSRGLGGQRWELSLVYNNMSEADFLPILAHVVTMRGSRNEAKLFVPRYSWRSSDASGYQVNGAHSIGDDTIAVDTGSGTFKAGDMLKFTGYDKVYMVTADLTGAGTLNIAPPLVADIANNTNVSNNGFAFTVRLSGEIQQFPVGLPSIYTFQVDVTEII